MLEIDSVAVPGFVIVTTIGALVLASDVGGKIIGDGETLMAGWPIMAAKTVNAPLFVACCPSGFVTITSRAPAGALLAMVMLAMICVAVREL